MDKRTEKKVKKALAARRAELLRSVVRCEKRINVLYGMLTTVLQAQLKNAPIDRIRKAVLLEIDRAMLALIPELEREIVNAVREGDSAHQLAYRRIFRRDIESIKTEAEVMAEAGARIRGRTTVDKVSLSTRVWGNNRRLGRRMAKAIQQSIRAGESMTRAAERIQALVPISEAPANLVTLPKHISDLRDAAKSAARQGDPNVYQAVAKRYAKRIERLGSAAGDAYSIRSATNQLVRELESAKPDQIDRVVQRYMTERARFQAQRVVRNETLEAYRESYIKSTEGKEYVKGYRWELSSNHPRPDECDTYAAQDLYGLGPGGYPPGEVPPTPHPLDMCTQVAIIDRDHFKRKLAQKRGTEEPPRRWESDTKETAEQWLKRQSADFRHKMLGPTLSKIFNETPGRVLDSTGKPRRVRDVLGDKA